MKKFFSVAILFFVPLLFSCINTGGYTYGPSTYIEIEVTRGAVIISGTETYNTDSQRFADANSTRGNKLENQISKIDPVTFSEGWTFRHKVRFGNLVSLTIQAISIENKSAEIKVTSPDGTISTYTLVPPLSSRTLTFTNTY